MRRLKTLEEFLKEGIVRKITPDTERAKSLIAEAERKKSSLNENTEKVGLKDENANDYVEHCYDIMMFLIRAKMYSEGYASSGQGAHEAEVAYTRKIGFEETTVEFLDQLRYFRNGILYYGKRLDAEYANKVLVFLNKTYPLLIELLKKLKEG